MTTVYICEKPMQGVDYGKALGFKDLAEKKGYLEDKNSDTVITWGKGHLFRLFEPYEYDEKYKFTKSINDLPIIPNKFEYKLGTSETELYKKRQFEIVEKFVKKATKIVIATDPDREGEVIAQMIIDKCGYKGPVTRVLTKGLDLKSLTKAIADMQDASLTYNLYIAGKARTAADWFIGINLSRAMTLINRNMVEGNLPVGRIIMPTVNLVYIRDMEIESFISKDYYEVSAEFHATAGKLKTSWSIPEKYLDELEEKLLKKEIADEVSKKCRNKDGKVTKAEKKRKQTAAPLPFSLLELQAKAYNEFGFKSDRVLELAQSLYEVHKATTYPRSDCQYLPNAQFSEVPEVLEAVMKTDPNNAEIRELVAQANPKLKSDMWNDSKVTAHHAIIPTGTPANISRMNEDEVKLYDLIRRYYIAQFLPKYEYDSTVLEIECEGEVFKITGSMPAAQGWKIALKTKEKSADDEIPLLKVGETVKCVDTKTESKKTKPPARLNEATLLKEMQNASKYITNPVYKKIIKSTEGLGTSATRANIIKNAFKYEYIKNDKNGTIITTEKARSLIKALPEMIKSVETSAYWESILEEIAKGENTPETFFEMQKKIVIEIIEEMKEGKYRIETAVGMTYQCPKCNSGLKRVKSLKNGKFYWVCLDKEVCKSIFPDNRGKPGEVIEREVVDQGTVAHKCTKCSEALVRKKGQYGFYWQCSLETCKQNYKDDNMTPVEIVKKVIAKDYQCPVCKKGFLVERGKEGKKFWGCSAYPACKTTKKDDGGKPEGF